eukprot:1195484-Prorocentrum_minimum.AAC.7
MCICDDCVVPVVRRANRKDRDRPVVYSEGPRPSDCLFGRTETVRLSRTKKTKRRGGAGMTFSVATFSASLHAFEWRLCVRFSHLLRHGGAPRGRVARGGVRERQGYSLVHCRCLPPKFRPGALVIHPQRPQRLRGRPAP